MKGTWGVAVLLWGAYGVFSAFAQWYEPFDHPQALQEWVGDTDAFAVESGRLRLDDDSPQRVVAIWHEVILTDTVEWQVVVDMPFPPSGQNNARIYLMSDSAHPQPSTAYYLQLGQSGGVDGIDLVRWDSAGVMPIVHGIDSSIAQGMLGVHLRVRYLHPGRWEVYSDVGGTMHLEGVGVDTMMLRNGFFGLYCRHTSSRRRSFAFDDVYVGPPPMDTIPPRIRKLTVINAGNLQLHFTEPIVSGMPTDTHRFHLVPYRPIQSVGWQDSSVVLALGVPLDGRRSYVVICDSIVDTAGNVRVVDSLQFVYYVPMLGDVVINEMMADPVPSRGLPVAEFVELLNTTPWPIPLGGWRLGDLGRTAIFPDDTLPPGGYLILTLPMNRDSFSGLVISLPMMPTLNNSGDSLFLETADSVLMDNVRYARSWHLPGRQDGGWSLERISPFNSCNGPENWTSSSHPNGGTPGLPNSVYNPFADTVPPRIIDAHFEDDHRLRLDFSERIFLDSLHLSAMPALPLWSDSLAADQRTLWIDFHGLVVGNIPYRFVIWGVMDCWGNQAPIYLTVVRQVPMPARPFTVRITELMPDPDPPVRLPNSEYVELMNISEDTLQLWDWVLSDGNRRATLPPYLLLPQSYVILVHARDSALWSSYPNVLPIQHFPSLNNDGDSLLLFDPVGTLIDFVEYTPAWGVWNVLKAEGGWSYEMKDPSIQCRTPLNWGFSDDLLGGTPGRPNVVVPFEDTMTPFLLGAELRDPYHLRLFFSESIHPTALLEPVNYLVDDSISPIGVFPDSLRFRYVTLALPVGLDSGSSHSLLISGVVDCGTNQVHPPRLLFGTPVPPAPGDLVISEVLVQPDADGVEFVELYNRTNRWIDATNVWLVRISSDTLVSRAVRFPMPAMPPNAYWVFTSDPVMLQQRYAVVHPEWVYQVDLFSLPDDSARLAILTSTMQPIDQMAYHTSILRPPYIPDPRGLSIERRADDADGLRPATWSYASTMVGATPTAPNSQVIPEVQSWRSQPATLSFYTLTPDGDGVRDRLQIHYRFPEGGYHVTLTVFDRNGRWVYHQQTPDRIGSQGVFEWSPQTSDHRLLPPGLYFGIWEYYHPVSGQHGAFRFSFSVVYP